MEYRIVDSFDSLLDLEKDWTRLEQSSDIYTYGSSYTYNRISAEVNLGRKDQSLWIVVIVQNGVVISIIPLVIKTLWKWGMQTRKLEFNAIADYADVLVDYNTDVRLESIYKEFFRVLETNVGLWDEIELTHLSQYSSFIHFLMASSRNAQVSYLIENPILVVDDYFDEKGIKSSLLPDKTKQYANRLKKAADYEFIVSQDDLLEQFAKIHKAERDFLHNQGNDERRSLFDDFKKTSMFHKLFKERQVTSYYLKDRQADKIIIYNFGFIYNGTFHSAITAFDPSYARYGVGKVLYYEMLLYAKAYGDWDVLDAGCGRYQWKFEWTNKFNLLYRFRLINPNNKGIVRKEKFLAVIRAFKGLFR